MPRGDQAGVRFRLVAIKGAARLAPQAALDYHRPEFEFARVFAGGFALGGRPRLRGNEFADKIRKTFEMTGKGIILLVEDEALVAMVTADMLRDLGFKVEAAATAAAALDLARRRSEALSAAIIDINLPDGKGDELAKRLRALKPDLPIVIATGEGDKTLASELKEGAPLALLSKPYDSGGLQKSLLAVGLG